MATCECVRTFLSVHALCTVNTGVMSVYVYTCMLYGGQCLHVYFWEEKGESRCGCGPSACVCVLVCTCLFVCVLLGMRPVCHFYVYVSISKWVSVCVPLSAQFQHESIYVYTFGQVSFRMRVLGVLSMLSGFPSRPWEMSSASLAPGRKALSLSGQGPGAARQPS